MSEDIETKEVQEEQEEVEEPTYSKEETEKYVKQLRKENEKLRKESQKKLEQEKEAKKVALEEQGKFKELYEASQKELESSKSDGVKTRKLNALELALIKEQAKFPDLLVSKFDLEKIELEGNTIKDWETVITPYKEQYKDLFGEKKIVGYDPNKSNKNTEGVFTQEQMDKMSDSELVDNYDKVMESIKK